ncbi:MAG: ribbon-helix-helix domain-containing protein [Anaeromyxobacteraceae bacterium]|nr:ribbon-helix-helix domain-containing protein [Anaeromyxobacteraceae bacterium]
MTLPIDLVARIDRLERNRSRFITEAVQHELERRRREALLRSLEHPHPEAVELAAEGLAEWGAGLPPVEDDLLDPQAGQAVSWVEGQGWVEGT